MNGDIGAKIGLVLEQKGISIDDLVDRSNLRKDQLEIILRGQFTPSITLLRRIAEALDVSLNILMDGTENAALAICRKSDRHEGIYFSGNNEEPNRSFKFFSMAGEKASRSMEPFMLILEKSVSDVKKKSSHEGEEFIYVVDGELELSYGDTTKLLQSGDSIYFDSVVPHAFRNLTEKTSILCVVNSPW